MRVTTMSKQIDILKQIILASTGEYCEINLSKNVVPGIMYQEFDGEKYNINEMTGISENASFTEVVKYWGDRLLEKDKSKYFDFFDLSNLLSSFERGEEHLTIRYWTKTILQRPMMAEHHFVMYKNEETGDISAISYVLDMTERYKEELYKKRLEEHRDELETRLEESSELLNTERKYLNVLYRNYILAYHLDVDKPEAEVLSLDERAHVWKIPGMRKGNVFNYDEHIDKFARLFIISGALEFREMLSRDYMKRQLKSVGRYSFRIKCIPNINGNSYYEIQVVRVNKEVFDGRVIIVSQEIDDTVQTEAQNREKLNTERKYLDVLTRDFVAVYHVNLKENISRLIKVDENIDGYDAARVNLRQDNDYLQKMIVYRSNFVVSAHGEEFGRIMMPENILKELKSSPRFVYRYETIQRNKKKKYFEVQVLRMNDDPESGDVLIAFRDIDDVVTKEQRQQAELKRRLEREMIQNEVLTALGNSYYTIFRIDLNNDTYEQLRCRDEVKHFYKNYTSASKELSTFCEDYIEAEYKEKMKQFLELGTLKKRLKEKETIEAECITTDGDWRRVGFIVKRRNDDGEVSHVLYVTQVISDEKNREERLISIAEAANEANKAKTEFVSRVAHDIRTPMNSLFGFLQIAEANVEDREKVKYSLKKIRVAGDFLKELVNDVLDISKMENGKLTLDLKEMSVDSLFKELPTSMGGADFGKNIEFSYDIHDIYCDRVLGDALRLKQIYTNILSNAIKYTPNGGKINFEVYEERAETDNEVYLIVRVADNGIGMSSEFMKKMFSKFERATDTRLNEVSGYGLGLTIVKQLVDMMGGSVDVESQLGKGTRFTVKIKFSCVGEVINTKKHKKNYTEVCKGMHLLVAEDNELSREVMKELLEMNGITCDMAADGAECVEMFKNRQHINYDAVLMDMQMPNMNGIEAARCIRSLDDEKAKTIPIVAMTANALSSDVKSCMEAGMNKHLSKPMDVNKLLRVLGKLT